MVFGEVDVVAVDDESALGVAPRVQSSLHVLAAADVFGHEHVLDVVDEPSLLGVRLVVSEEKVPSLDCGFGSGGNEMEDERLGLPGNISGTVVGQI